MSQDYFIGKVIGPSKKKSKSPNEKIWSVQDSTTNRMVECQINFFCPLEEGDSIAVDDYNMTKDQIYILTSRPIVIIGKDDETIEKFIMKTSNPKQRSEGFKIYKMLCSCASTLKKSKEQYVSYVNDICCRWAAGNQAQREVMIFNRFKDLDPNAVRLFLENWYKRRVLRQFYVFGFTLTEIHNIKEFHSSTKNISELFQEFIHNPYIFFTVHQDKIHSIATKLQKDSDENIKIYKALRELYIQFMKGRNGYSIEEFCQKFPDMLKKIEPWIHPFKGYIYFLSTFEKEKEIAGKIKTISEIKTNYPINDEQIDDLSSDQKEAVAGILQSPIGIISGPAGSGKTTILKKIVSIIEEQGDKVIISAFTGKAVARLKQVLQRPDPQTLHYLLNKPVDFNVLIIDEASMVSSALLHEILITFEHSFRIYLIGDVSQLPPIEWGRPFYDLIMTKRIPTHFLTKCHRFYEQSGDVNGILENATGMIKDKDWKWLERKNFKILKKSTIVKVIERVIESGISMKDFTILCPFNKPLKDINQRASQMFLPESQTMVDPAGTTWRIGDRVINLKNRYDYNIMNGDDGEVIDFTANGLKVKFAELELEFLFTGAATEDDTREKEDENLQDIDNGPATTKHLVQSYGMTVHKAQGSEWDFVLLYVPFDGRGFVTKNLFYTAITRARQCLWIIPENANCLQKVIEMTSEFGRDALSMLYE
jgi:CRISPR/Cas system CSM-associated protein Csm2 small subunit/energy-coupling factor transporter ATP-binding protein EcfA2